MENFKIDYQNFKVTKKHKEKINKSIRILLNKYSLQKVNFKLKFQEMYAFGVCFPSWKIFKREVTIYINKDLLEEKLFIELKGTLSHEFAHFFHYVNFSTKDYFIFLFKMGSYLYSRKFSKSKINLFSQFAQNYEQITDLTAYNFNFSKELIRLKKYTSIYRKNLPKFLVPKSSNYLDHSFLKKLKDKTFSIKKETKIRFDKLNLKSLKYSKV